MTATKLKLGIAGAVIVAGVLVVLFSQRPGNDSTGKDNSVAASAPESAAAELAGQGSRRATGAGLSRREQNAAPVATPEEIVAGRLSQYARSRRELVQALAQRHGVEVPDDVKRFFDAVESGNWNEIDARFKVLAGTEPNASASASGRQPGLEKLWSAIIDAYGAAEQIHLWPAQQLLETGAFRSAGFRIVRDPRGILTRRERRRKPPCGSQLQRGSRTSIPSIEPADAFEP